MSHILVTPGNPDRTLTLPKVLPAQFVGGFTVRNLGPNPVRAGSAVYQSGGKLVVKDSSGRVLATLKPGQSAAVALKPRRKLRRIGGSDRLWRALRGGR